MILAKKILFIDMYLTTIAYILEDELDYFYAIDVGMPENDEEIELFELKSEPYQYEHGFDGESSESIFISFKFLIYSQGLQTRPLLEPSVKVPQGCHLE